MRTVSSFLREPLLHFLLLGAALFGLYHLVGNRSDSGSDSPERIVVTPAQVQQLAYVFSRTRQRPPTRQELQGLVQDRIREEVLYRKALALGLDQNDIIVRRRLSQKMDFISNDVADQAEPTDQDLQEFLKEHEEKFRLQPRLSFEHIYFNTDRRGDAAGGDAQRLLDELGAETATGQDPASLGDALLLPHKLEIAAQADIAAQFGDTFARRLLDIEPGRWAGPVESGYGLHLVRISQREEGRVPELAEIRQEVEREWLATNRREVQETFYQGLRDQYAVVVQWPEVKSGGEAMTEVSE